MYMEIDCKWREYLYLISSVTFRLYPSQSSQTKLSISLMFGSTQVKVACFERKILNPQRSRLLRS
jgi:hypothetical protein